MKEKKSLTEVEFKIKSLSKNPINYREKPNQLFQIQSKRKTP